MTETDQAVEKLVKARISEAYPAHKYVCRAQQSRSPLTVRGRFIGEESFAGGERADLTDEPTWIVDPSAHELAAAAANADEDTQSMAPQCVTTSWRHGSTADDAHAELCPWL